MEFLGRRFEKIDARFDRIDARLDRIEARLDGIEARLDGIEARLLRVEVGGEEARDLIKLNAEGILGVDERLARFRREVARRFDGLEHRVDRLEVA